MKYKTTPLLAASLLAMAFVTSARAESLSYVEINDSTTYVRVNDPDTVALTLDIRTDYRLPSSGIKPAHLLKMADMLMTITGVDFDEEGYPAPSGMTGYEGGRWVPANDGNTAYAKTVAEAKADEAVYLFWSEEPQIKPVYEDADRLSMLASNYVYTGGAHGMYTEYCVNYSLRDQQFVYLKDILPGLDRPEVKKRYEEIMVPMLTSKARRILSEGSGGTMTLLADKVYPTGNFAFTADGIVFRYQPYEIAPWACGVVEVPLNREEIARIIEIAGVKGS